MLSGAVPCSPPWKSQSLGETSPQLTFELVMLPASGRECTFYQRGGLGRGVQGMCFLLLSKVIHFTAPETHSVVHTFNCFELSAVGTLLVTCAADSLSSI